MEEPSIGWQEMPVQETRRKSACLCYREHPRQASNFRRHNPPSKLLPGYERDNLGRACCFLCAVRSNLRCWSGFQHYSDFTGFPTPTLQNSLLHCRCPLLADGHSSYGTVTGRMREATPSRRGGERYVFGQIHCPGTCSPVILISMRQATIWRGYLFFTS